MPDDRLLYEARTALVPWAKDDDHCALHFIIEGHNCDIFLCQGDAEDLAFWQALGRLWAAAPLMQLRLKEARDAIATLPPGVLGVTSFPDFYGDMDEDGNLRDGVPYDVTNVYTRDLLLGNIERALREEKGEGNDLRQL